MTNTKRTVGPAIASEQDARIAAGFFTIAEPARDLGQIHGWHAPAVDTLQKQMVQAVRDGTLAMRHPHTHLPYRPEPVREWYELTTRADVSA